MSQEKGKKLLVIDSNAIIRRAYNNYSFMKNYIPFVLVVAVLLVAGVAYMQPSGLGAKAIEDDFVITLDTPTSAGVVIKKAKNNNVRLIQLESTFNMNGQMISDVYVIKPSDMSESDIEHGFLNGRNAVADLNNKNVAEVNRLTTIKQKETGFSLPKMKGVNVSTDIAKPLIKRMTVHGEKSQAQSMADQLGGKLKNVRESVTTTNDTPNVVAKILGIKTAFAITWNDFWNRWINPVYRGTITTGRTKDMEKWVPEAGYAYIGQYSNTGNSFDGDRYSYNLMWWDDVSDFKSGSSWWGTDGYEQKVLLHNYDGKTYMKNEKSFFYGVPSLTYAASNLPDAYVDTRLDDDNVEVSYTIGSGRGDLISANTPGWYWTQFFTDPGNDTVDKFKTQAHLVTEYYSMCYYTWGTYCMFGDTSVPITTLIPFSSGNNVPTNGWQYFSY
ncbi:MAG: hypothetical protein Q7R99_04185 [bacterium]|nr:hypothetical protein [bacterium]